MTNKAKLLAFGALFTMVVVLVVVAQAQAATLTASCAGSVSGNQITWTATSSGSNSPYGFLWSGDSHVAGSTSTSITATYAANGTYSAIVTATDASSTTATGTCSATVTSIPAPTSTLDVFVSVNNSSGGGAVPSSFMVSISGANAVPSSFAGSSSGTAVVVNASTTYAVVASSLANYTASTNGNCSGPISAGGTASCTIMETFVPASTTPPPPPPAPQPKIMKPSLSIQGENGQFLAHGMIVTSVGAGSFQAQVWGITYTVDWSGILSGMGPLEFFFRNDKANSTTTPVQQIAVGDEVGVSGRVTTSSPMVVAANVVRDYSITAPRPANPPEKNSEGKGNGNENNEGNGSSNMNGDVQNRLNNLMNQLRGLQDLFRSRFGH